MKTSAIALSLISAILVSIPSFSKAASAAPIDFDTDEKITMEVYRSANPAVVTIKTATSTGSGSIISPEGLVITNEHVIRDRFQKLSYPSCGIVMFSLNSFSYPLFPLYLKSRDS